MKAVKLILASAALGLVASCTSVEGLTDVPGASPMNDGATGPTVDAEGRDSGGADADSAAMSMDGPAPTTVQLSVRKSGPGGGLVSDSHFAIDCGLTCSATFPVGTKVDLTAQPDPTSIFVGWTGGGCSGNGACSLTMDASTTVTAQFNPSAQALSVSFNAIGAGQSAAVISSSPAGITCSAASGQCTTSANFPWGSPVQLTVSGTGATSLSAWLPATCTGNTCTVTMTSAQSVTYWVTGNNIVFTTNTVHDGNLGGIAGATTLCADTALGAGLPGHYVPWLATTTVNATTPLASARGWIRPDGLPFADTLGTKGGTTGLINGQVYYPASVNQTGGVDFGEVWTGSNPDGSAFQTNVTCGDWTSNSATANGNDGVDYGVGAPWVSRGTEACSTEQSLYCFGTDLTTPVALSPQPGRVAFTSKGTLTGSAGLAAADTLCQSEASAASLPNAANFVALMATSSASAASRLSASGENWVRPDGLRLATSAVSLLTGGQIILLTPSLHADGTLLATGTTTWAGADAIGDSGTDASTCSDWTTASPTSEGATGLPQSVYAYWFGGGSGACNLALHVFCFEK